MTNPQSRGCSKWVRNRDFTQLGTSPPGDVAVSDVGVAEAVSWAARKLRDLSYVSERHSQVPGLRCAARAAAPERPAHLCWGPPTASLSSASCVRRAHALVIAPDACGAGGGHVGAVYTPGGSWGTAETTLLRGEPRGAGFAPALPPPSEPRGQRRRVGPWDLLPAFGIGAAGRLLRLRCRRCTPCPSLGPCLRLRLSRFRAPATPAPDTGVGSSCEAVRTKSTSGTAEAEHRGFQRRVPIVSRDNETPPVAHSGFRSDPA